MSSGKYQLNKPVKELNKNYSQQSALPVSVSASPSPSPAAAAASPSAPKLFSSSRGKQVTQFFDDQLTAEIYGRKSHKHAQESSVAASPKKKQAMVVINGKLTVNKQLLTEEWDNEFDGKWFLEDEKEGKKLFNDKRARTKKVFKVDKKLCDMPMILPRVELGVTDHAREKYKHVELLDEEEEEIHRGEVALQSIDPFYSGQLNNMSVMSNTSLGHSSVVSNQQSELMSVARLLDDFEASLFSAPYLKNNTLRPSTAPILAGECESHRMRQLIAEKQKKSLEILYRSKSSNFRPNNPKKTVTPDYVLFVESLHRDILIYPAESVGSERSMVNHQNSLDDPLDDTAHSASTRKTTMLASPSMRSSKEEKDSSHNLMSRFEDDVLLVQNSKIMSLDLNNRGIGCDRGQCLAVALQYCPHLQTMKLKNNRLNDITLSVILQAAFGFAQLQYLDVSENDGNKLTVGIFCDYVHCNMTNDAMVTPGNLFDNSVCSVKSTTNCSLTYVNLSSCGFGDDLSGKIARALITNNTIQELHVDSNRIGAEESQSSFAWGELIEKNQTLVVLTLRNNYLRKFSAQLVLKSLHFNRSIVYLNLASNQISDLDVIVSAPFLEKNTTLQSLDLSSNMIENNGCIALSYCLSQLTCLNFTSLNLLGNKIGDIGFKFAIERMLFVLHQNYELHYAVYHQQHNKSKSRFDSTTSHSIKSKNKNNSSTSTENAAQKPKELPQIQPPRIYRLLNILCHPVKDNDRISARKLFNPLDLSGKYEFNLSDAFDQIRARICMDALERNPCIRVKEFKWFNDVVKGFEYPSITRELYSNLNILQPIMDANHHICSDEKRGLTNSTPRKLYTREYENITMTDPFDNSHKLISLLFRLINLLNQSVDEKLKSAHLFQVKSVLYDLGQKLSLNITPEVMFFLLERWHRLDAFHARHRISEIYAPWKRHLEFTAESTSSKKPPATKKKSSVYQDIEDDLKRESEKKVGEVLLSDPVVILKFVVCTIYDYILGQSSDMTIQQLYQDRHILLQARTLAANDITITRSKAHKLSTAFDILPPDHDKIQMNSYERLVRMISELAFEYNSTSSMDQDKDKEKNNDVRDVTKRLDSSGRASTQQPQVQLNIDDEELKDPVNDCFIHASQFLQYIILQLQEYTMISHPYQSIKIVSNSISDVRNNIPSHGILSLDFVVPIIQGSTSNMLDQNKHYLLDGFLSLLSYDYGSYNVNHILDNSTNDANKLFSNISNLNSNLLLILEYDDNILHLSCEEAEILLKLVYSAKEGYHMHMIERLLFQIANVNEARRFVIRNCYFHEVIWLRKKLSFLFKVLTGSLNGHYLLDLNDSVHRRAAQRLAAVHNEHLYLVQDHIQTNKRNNSQVFPKTSGHDSISSFIVSPDIEQLYFRNSSYNGSYVAVTSEWLQNLPSVGKLRFDYVDFLGLEHFIAPIMPTTVQSHTNIKGSALLESMVVHSRYHQLQSNTFGSSLNFDGVSDAMLSATSSMGKVTIDHAYNRVYSNAYHTFMRDEKHVIADERFHQAELLKREGYSDLLLHQMFSRGVYRASQKIYKKLRIPPKNSEVYDVNDPNCREYLNKLRSIERANAASKPVAKQNDVLNIMMKRFNRPALSYGLKSATPTVAPAAVESEIKIDEEDEEPSEEEEDSDSDESIVPNKPIEVDSGQISKKSYFRLQDESNNLDTGARQAFFLKPSLHASEDSEDLNASPKKPVVLHNNTSLVDKVYEVQNISLWKDYLETTWTCYNNCCHDNTLKKAQQIFALIQKENSHSYQYHYSGADKDGFPDELFQSNMYMEIAKAPIQQSIAFNINAGRRRKTQATAASPESGKVNNKTSILQAATLNNRRSVTSSVDLLTPAAQQSSVFELSLLILESCCLYNIWLEVVQVKSILENYKAQKASHEVMVRCAITIWKFVIDKENLPTCVRKTCGEAVYQDCVHRLGFLFFWSPIHPEGKYDLDLTDRQHRDVLAILAALLLEDATIEAVDAQYQPSRLHPFETIDISRFALDPPHSIGSRLKPTKTEKPSGKARPSTGRSVSSGTSNKDAPPFIFGGDFKTGRLTLRVKQKPLPLNNSSSAEPSSPKNATKGGDNNNGNNINAQAQTQTQASTEKYSVEMVARQQAARRVYARYKEVLQEQYLLQPFAEEQTASKNAMDPYFAHNIYPLFK